MKKLGLETFFLSAMIVATTYLCVIIPVVTLARASSIWTTLTASGLIIVGIIFVTFPAIGIVKNINLMRKVKQIIERGGPESFDEYMIIFPDVCHHCGSRDLICTHWEGSFIDGAIGVVRESGTYTKCARCGHHIEGELDGWGSFDSSKVRVHSPYLTEEQSNDISDFPYTTSELQI